MAKKKEEPINPIDAVIERITADQVELETINKTLDEAKESKREIVDRLKGSRKDLEVLLKYATDEQKEKVEELGFGTATVNRSFNNVAQIVIDVMTEKKKMTNGELYKAYVEELPEGAEAQNYTQFNIKMRSCFNRELLTREKVDGAKNSRDDMIILVETKK